MARKCEETNRGPQFGNSRSKALNSSRKKWSLNLQNKTIIVNGEKVKTRMSTKAIRTMKKNEKK